MALSGFAIRGQLGRGEAGGAYLGVGDLVVQQGVQLGGLGGGVTEAAAQWPCRRWWARTRDVAGHCAREGTGSS